jgi:uncharacterized 2Fe-2S/4Fe-4S cluster protein (DUF4445 family)
MGIEAMCGGQRTCGKCAVVIAEGEFARHGLISSRAHLSAPDDDELNQLSMRALPAETRLACVARVCGDLLVNVPPEAQLQKQVIHKTAGVRQIELDPIVRLCLARLAKPDEETGSLRAEVLRQVEFRFGLRGVEFELPALQELPGAVQAGGGEITLTVWDDRRILRVQPGLQERALGLAVDIGSTTLAVYLCDLRSGELLASAAGMNPQAAYGDDILARISYCAAQTDGLERLQRLVVEAITELGEQTAEQAGAAASDIVDCVWVGNSVMMHLALGITPASLGETPFMPVFSTALDLPAAQVGLGFHPAARLHALPLIAGYVGADCVAAILAEDVHHRVELTLLVDAGTNGEIVLGNREGLICTSSPTGPAFEGAQIAYGMRAAPGGIERVRVDEQTLEVDFQVIGSPLWSRAAGEGAIRARGICGSGILEAVAELYRAGVLLPGGRFDPQCRSRRLVRAEDGQWGFVLAVGEQSASGNPILVTQADVRAVQLAKAALFSGANYLLRHSGVEQIEQVVLAGGFGSLLDAGRAMLIGMIPSCPPERVRAAGNAAGDGARIALLNRAKRREAEWIAENARHVVMPQQALFQEQFVAALAFPPREGGQTLIDRWSESGGTK